MGTGAFTTAESYSSTSTVNYEFESSYDKSSSGVETRAGSGTVETTQLTELESTGTGTYSRVLFTDPISANVYYVTGEISTASGHSSSQTTSLSYSYEEGANAWTAQSGSATSETEGYHEFSLSGGGSYDVSHTVSGNTSWIPALWQDDEFTRSTQLKFTGSEAEEHSSSTVYSSETSATYNGESWSSAGTSSYATESLVSFISSRSEEVHVDVGNTYYSEEEGDNITGEWEWSLDIEESSTFSRSVETSQSSTRTLSGGEWQVAASSSSTLAVASGTGSHAENTRYWSLHEVDGAGTGNKSKELYESRDEFEAEEQFSSTYYSTSELTGGLTSGTAIWSVERSGTQSTFASTDHKSWSGPLTAAGRPITATCSPSPPAAITVTKATGRKAWAEGRRVGVN